MFNKSGFVRRILVNKSRKNVLCVPSEGSKQASFNLRGLLWYRLWIFNAISVMIQLDHAQWGRPFGFVSNSTQMTFCSPKHMVLLILVLITDVSGPSSQSKLWVARREGGISRNYLKFIYTYGICDDRTNSVPIDFFLPGVTQSQKHP